MRGKLSGAGKWLWGILPILSLVGIRVYEHYASKILVRVWPEDLLLVLGWVVGWLLADADYLFYALVTNPQEMTSQRIRQELKNRSWGRAWEMISETKKELTKLPIRNILTAFVMTGVGVWVVSSSSSLIAAGLCLGFCVRLFSEMLTDVNYKRWYWLFARDFLESEHRGLLLAWGIVLIWQWSVLIRG
jgi:hypothetical protein